MSDEDNFLDALLSSEDDEDAVVEEAPKNLTPKSYTVDNKKIDAPEDIQTLLKRLQGWNKGCRDLFIDLRAVTFGANDDDMYLDFDDKAIYNKRLYFKVNPTKPKDPKVIHAAKQFVKLLGVPYSFFAKNRPTLKVNMVSTWKAGLQAESDDKCQVLSRIREGDDSAIIRALLPIKHATMHNHDLLGIIAQQVKVPYHLEFVHDDDKDDLVLHARFLFEQEGMLLGNIPVCAGFSLICSELGASPLIFDTFLHDKLSKTSYIASYGGEPFFSTKYEGIQANEIKDMIPKLVERMSNQMPDMIKTIENLNAEIDPRVEASKVVNWGGSNDKFKKALFHEVAECSKNMSSAYEFARHISLIAKDSDSLKRLSQERLAGRYLDFFFEKN